MAKGQKKQKLTPECVGKLEYAFSIDATVEEACYYADISRDTYYTWIKENKVLADKFERLRQRPVLTARDTVSKSLNTPQGAQWYLERKKKLEFSTRQELGGEINLKVEKLGEIQNATKEILNGEDQKAV
jgi:hypothetical protein